MNQQTKILKPLTKPAEELMKDALHMQEQIDSLSELIEELESKIAKIKVELLEHDIKEAGNYQLFEKSRTVRTVNIDRFREKYPEIYERLKQEEISRATINAGKNVTVKDAEFLLGKASLDPVCDLKITSTYTFQKKFLD